MYCTKCGADIKNNSKFCPYCGETILKKTATLEQVKSVNTDKITSNMPIAQTHKKKKMPREKMSKGKKAKIICISVLAVIAVTVVSLVAVYFTSPAYSVYKNLQDVDCSTAIREYNSSVEDSFIQKIFIKFALNGYSEKILGKFKDGKMEFDDALSILEAMKEMGVKDIEKIIDEVNRLNEAKSAFNSANKYYEDGDYENAIKEYSKITDTDSQFSDAQAKLTELYPKYASTVSEKVKQLTSSGDYVGALSLISTALDILPDDSAGKSELSQTKSDCLNRYKKEIIDNTTAMITEKSYVDAINYINKAISVDDNEDFQNIKATAEKEYVNSVTATVNDFIKQEDYISASRNVKAALDVLPNNSSLIALQKTVDNATPTYLLDVCKPYQFSDDYKEYINGEVFSIGGKQFTNGFTINTGWYDLNYAIFNLDNNYTQLSFYTGHVDGTSGGNGKIKIYLDGILSKEIEANDQALSQKVVIDITGVKQLKFEVTYAGGDYGFGNVTVK